jgi:ABC-type sugar transport system, periplasmic component
MLRLLKSCSAVLLVCFFLASCGGAPASSPSSTDSGSSAAPAASDGGSTSTDAPAASGDIEVRIPPALEKVPTDDDPRDGKLSRQPVPEGYFPIVDEKVTLRVAVANQPSVEDFATNEFTKWYEEKTNVHVEWIVLPEGEDGIQKLNLMLSSGDIPDVIMGFSMTAAQIELYGSQGIFIPLNDLIETYGVNIKNAFAQYPLAKDVVTSPSGNIYSLPEINDCYHCSVAQKLWIYKPWLDTLGLEMPTTLDEYVEVLRAFKEKDPNGNGIADEIPLTTNVNGWNSQFDFYFMNSFLYNPTTRRFMNNGKVDVTYNKPEWREGLRFLNKLYEEGLLDPNGFTQDTPTLQRVGQAEDNVVGSIPWGYPGWLPIENVEGARWNQYVVVPPLKGPNGFAVQPLDPYNPFSVGKFIITSAAKSPAVALRWADGFYQQEIELSAYFGPQGIGWEWAEEGQKGINGEQALYVALKSWGNIQNDQWMQANPSFRSSDFRLTQMSDNPFELETVLFNESAKLTPMAQDPALAVPPLYFSAEDAQEVAEYEQTLKKIVEEMLARFTIGDLDIDNDADWQSYLDALDQAGLARYLELCQKAYDSKQK